MGKQVNFFMTRVDETHFLEFVRGSGDVHILPYTSPAPSFEPIDISHLLNANRHWDIVWLYNDSVSNKLVTRYVAEQRYFTIDRFASSVIEFSPCHLKPPVLHRGRIWAEFSIADVEHDRWIRKEPEFEKWYDSIARWIRRNYEKIGSVTYVGPDAQKVVGEGRVELRFN